MEIDVTLVETIILTFIRVATAIVIMPVFGYEAVSIQIKGAISLIIAISIGGIVATVDTAIMPSTLTSFLAVAIVEILVGLIFGIVATLCLLPAQMAGGIIGVQMGYSIVSVLDPLSGEQTSIIGQMKYMLALVIFVSLDFHRIFLGTLIESFTYIPIGKAVFSAEIVPEFTKLTSLLFVISLKIAAPIVAILLLSEISLGFIARTVPQMNVFIIGFPIKIGLGMFGIITILPLFGYLMNSVFQQFNRHLEFILRMMSGI